LLGVSGGIAAYKAAELARLLIKAGAEVRVVMTRAATEFVAPMSFQALTGRPVRTELFDAAHEAAMGHIELARWADAIVIAPASANLLARLAHGLADDLLSTLCLAATAPLVVAPAMNQAMWGHPATQSNLELLRERGTLFAGPAEGEQACGDTGVGRMAEPEQILRVLSQRLIPVGPLTGVQVLLTAGPTREALDPVRYLGNRSSGKMGYALAEALALAGARVTLISGPVALAPPTGVERILVESALQMHAAVMQRIAAAGMFVACAAVADYRPEAPAEQKIKKDVTALELRLIKNPDILADVAARENPPFTVGFAAETENVERHAEAKRQAKRIDMIAANRVGEVSGAGIEPSLDATTGVARLGFESDDNALTVLWDQGRQVLPRQPKRRLAQQLVELIAERWHAKTAAQDT
jgi:phosphopantothenoylcysteine decarboxylase/phosphopantothenate--cysteine ligase